MPLTQSDIDTRRAAMFTAYANKRSPAGLLAAAQNAYNLANTAWVNALGAFRALPDNATPADISAAEALVTSTELARTEALSQLGQVQSQIAGLPAAADQAAVYYRDSAILFGNGG